MSKKKSRVPIKKKKIDADPASLNQLEDYMIRLGRAATNYVKWDKNKPEMCVDFQVASGTSTAMMKRSLIKFVTIELPSRVQEVLALPYVPNITVTFVRDLPSELCEDPFPDYPGFHGVDDFELF